MGQDGPPPEASGGDGSHRWTWEVLAPWRRTRLLILTAISAALYAAVLIPFKAIPIIPGVTEVRPANAIPILTSLVFGPAGAWGSAFGNLVGDFFGTLGPGTFFGMLGNFLYGLIPYCCWRAWMGDRPPVGLGWRGVAPLTGAILLASAACGMSIGWGIEWLGFAPFRVVANVITLNNVFVSLVLAPLLVAFFYPRVRDRGLRYVDLCPRTREWFPGAAAAGTALVAIGCGCGMVFGNLAPGGVVGVPSEPPAAAGASVGVAPWLLVLLAGCLLMSRRVRLPVAANPAPPPEAAPGPLLQVTDVTFAYAGAGRPAVRGVEFRLEPGGFVFLGGRTGAGRTSLLRCLTGVAPQFYRGTLAGEIRLHGRGVGGRRVCDLAGEMGSLFQDFEAQLFSSRVSREMAFGPENLGRPPAAIRAGTRRYLELLGLGGFEERSVTRLSGGERQRLAVASVLALEAPLLLLDEPTTDLDPEGKRMLFRLLPELRAAGRGLVLADQETEGLAPDDPLLLLEAGRPVFQGPVAAWVRRAEATPAEGAETGFRPFPLFRLCHRLGLPPADWSAASVAAAVRGGRLRFRTPAPAAAPAPGAPLFRLEGASYRYPDGPPALEGVDLQINEGEVVAIVGRNGSGKTTLGKLLKGILTPTGGRCLLRERPVTDCPLGERAREIGYLFQSPDFQIFHHRVREEVAFGPRILGRAGLDLERAVAAALAATGLAAVAERDPFLLTKGERQRVALASALAVQPRVLILDEPTTGLDLTEQAAMGALLRKLSRQGTTILFITHSLETVAALATRVIALAAGKVIADGPPREVLARRAVVEAAALAVPDLWDLPPERRPALLTWEEALAQARIPPASSPTGGGA